MNVKRFMNIKKKYLIKTNVYLIKYKNIFFCFFNYLNQSCVVLELAIPMLMALQSDRLIFKS